MGREEDNAHPAASEHRLDPVVAERLADAGLESFSHSRRTRPQPVTETARVLDQVLGIEGLQLLAQLPHELGQLDTRVHRLVGPHRLHQLVVRAERGRAADRGVSLDHVANQQVRLCTDLDLMPLVAPHEDESSLVQVVAEAFGRLCRKRDRFGDGACRLRVSGGPEGELEEAPLVGLRDRSDHADGVTIVERVRSVTR